MTIDKIDLGLPEGWFVSHDEVMYSPLDFRPIRHIKIQNGTDVFTSRWIYAAFYVQNFDLLRVRNKFLEKINEG